MVYFRLVRVTQTQPTSGVHAMLGIESLATPKPASFERNTHDLSILIRTHGLGCHSNSRTQIRKKNEHKLKTAFYCRSSKCYIVEHIVDSYSKAFGTTTGTLVTIKSNSSSCTFFRHYRAHFVQSDFLQIYTDFLLIISSGPYVNLC